MDHQQAIQLEAVDKYCLDELPAAQRAQFEEHFFDCRECASEVRITADFLDIARRELKRGNLGSAAPKPPNRSWFELFARPAVLTPAFGLLLAVMVYQNGVVLPRFNGQIARLSQPQVVATVSLIGGNSRGDTAPASGGSAGHPLLLAFDIPATRPYPGYDCAVIDATGTVVWRIPVSAAQAQDTVSISVPAGTLRAGNYTLVVRGLQAQGRGGTDSNAADLARYRFVLNPSP